MHRFMPACLQVVELIENHMPKIDSLDNADITVRLHLYKLQLSVLNELIFFIGKFSDSGNAANTGAIERLIDHKKLIQSVVDMIESTEKPAVLN